MTGETAALYRAEQRCRVGDSSTETINGCDTSSLAPRADNARLDAQCDPRRLLALETRRPAVQS